MAKDLTAVGVKAAEAKDGKRTEIPDGKVRGLYLVVQPSGAKSWAIRYRHPGDGRTRKVKLDDYPRMTLASAREVAEAKLMQVAAGKDPVEVERAEHEAAEAARRAEEAARIAAEQNTLEKVLERHLVEMRAAKKSPRYIEEFNGVMKREVLPTLGSHVVETITEAEVKELVANVRAAGKETQANRTLVYLKVLFRAHGCSTLDHMKPLPEESRERTLDRDEIRWLWQATENIGQPFGPLVRMLLLTGQRLREVAEMTEAELTEGGDWELPSGRVKNRKKHLVPLSDAARDVLAGVTRIAGSSGFIFTTTGTTPVSGFSRAKKNLDSAMAEVAEKERGEPFTIPPWRLHDLRRTAATGMAREKQPPYVIERVLNHSFGSKVAKAYNHYDYAAEKRAALEAWSRKVMQLVEGAADNVVLIGEARG